MFDARCLLAGVEAGDLSARRLCGLVYTMILDGPGLMFDDDERRKFVETFAWPDDADEMTQAEQDRRARSAAGQLGLSNPDDLIRQAAAARAAALASQEAD